MGFDANRSRSSCYWQVATFSALLLTACAGASDAELTQSTDALKGGIPANDKDKTNGMHLGHAGTQAQAGSKAHGRAQDDAGVEDDDGKNQGQGGAEGKDKGKAHAGSHAMGNAHAGSHAMGNAHVGSRSKGKGHAGSHAQGPKAGHEADVDDASEESDAMP